MSRLSADMEFTWCGMNSPAVSHYREVGHLKRHGKNYDLLIQKTEYLYEMRDSVKQDKIKELMLGTNQKTEYQKWLDKETEIEGRVIDIVRFNEESSYDLLFSCMKLPHGNLVNTLDEITDHLENAPLRHLSMAHTPYRATKTFTSARIGGKSYGHDEKNENVNQTRKSETKDYSDVEIHAQGEKAIQREETPHGKFAPSLDGCSPIPGNEKNPEFTEPKTAILTKISDDSVAQSPCRMAETLTSPRIESKTYGKVGKIKKMKIGSQCVPTTLIHSSPSSFKSIFQAFTGGSTFGLKDEVTAAVSGGEEVLIETVPTAVTEALLAADQASASDIEQKDGNPLQTDAPPMHESEIQHTCEIGREFSVKREENLDTIFDGIESMLPIPQVEFETVPSQTGCQMKSKLSSSVNQSVKPAARVEVSKSGPSNIPSVEAVTAASFRIEVSSMYNAETEVSHLSEAGQQLLESGSDVRRSINRTVLKILSSMSDVTARKIGVHGIGGIGKTSVLKALSHYTKTKGTFDLIMLVTISRSWSIRKIQTEVLRQLSFGHEDSEADFEVAVRLFQVLNGKKFLLLLDDVWEKFDLMEVGIPNPSSENGSKILMASRNSDICHDMDVDRVIKVETLSRQEAWELFYEQVGGIICSGDIQPFAQTIVEGCGGLPLLIIVTGRALVQETDISVWEHASSKFSPPTSGIYHVEGVIQQLKFSFDQLKDLETKSFFLCCSLFSEDREVSVFELIEYCIQEGIISGSQADAHKRGLDIIDVLVHNFLLQLSDSGDSIKMHDLIRDLALGILSAGESSRYLLRAYSRLMEPTIQGGTGVFTLKSHQFLLRAGAGLTEAPSEEEWKQAKMIFLMDNELCTLPQKPSCPELLTLYLQRNYHLRVIPVSFFDFMTSLKVLNLSKTRIKSLPKSLFKLENLQILILRDCDRLFTLPSEVGSLVCLEVLDLQGTQISRLPDEISNLESLRYLEVFFYGSINHTEYVKLPHQLVSSGVMSKLQSLGTLSIAVYPGDQRWYKDVRSVIVDLSSLTELRSISFYFPEVELLELFLQTSIAWNAQGITEFKFVVGHDVKSIASRIPEDLVFDYSQQSRCFRFVNGENISDAVLRTLACSTAFYLDHHLDVSCLTNLGLGNINGLNFCIVSECPKIETVVDSLGVTEPVFPSLENLSVHHLWNLAHIWRGILPKGSFAALRILMVHACPKLKYIFSSSMVELVSRLEELGIEDCPAVEEIIQEGEIIDSGCNTLPSLKKLTLHYLPGLVNISPSACPLLEHISFYDCPNLKKMCKDVLSKQTIKEIKAEKSWWDSLEWEDAELQLHLQDYFVAICEDDL